MLPYSRTQFQTGRLILSAETLASAFACHRLRDTGDTDEETQNMDDEDEDEWAILEELDPSAREFTVCLSRAN